MGLKKIISSSIESVFTDFNHGVQSNYEKIKFETFNRNKYIELIERTLASYQLFGTNITTSIDASYIKLGVSQEIEKETYKNVSEIKKRIVSSKTGEYIDSRIDSSLALIDALSISNNYLALLGSAGTGKTTAFRHLALTIAKGTPINGKKRIPIYIPVRELEFSEEPIEKFLIDFLSQLNIIEAKRVSHALLRDGSLTILVDGLDEASEELQTKIRKGLIHIKRHFSATILCVSARPYTLSMEFPGFTKWETLPLTPKNRHLFISKWFSVVDKNKGEKLIEASKSNSPILDIGSNPLLLSIVCALYHNDLNVPVEQDELYSRAIEGLLGAWDAFRSIARNTEIHDLPVRKRIALVSSIAFNLFTDGKIVFKNVDISRSVNFAELRRVLKINNFDTEKLTISLYNDFGLLLERAPNLFSFSHLTFHEFLTAQYIVDNRLEMKFIQKYLRNEDWFEVIKFIAQRLNKADDFMEFITQKVDIFNEYQMGLLEATWNTKPICHPDNTLNTFKRISGKYLSRITSLNLEISCNDGCWLILPRSLQNQDKKQPSRMSSEQLLAYSKHLQSLRKKQLTAELLLKNIPKFVSSIQSSGVTLMELGLADQPFFREILWCGESAPQRVIVQY